MDETDRRMLLSNAKLLYYKAGETVRGYFNNPGILLIQSGVLKTYLLSEEGKIVSVYAPKEGDICVLSTLKVIDNLTSDLHIDAHTDTETYAIPTEVFEKLAQKNIHVENFLNNRATQCLSYIVMVMEKMLFTSIDKRLSDFLTKELKEGGSNKISITHEQVATAIGSAREVVTRALRRMSDRGWVELSRGGIRILDPDRLLLL